MPPTPPLFGLTAGTAKAARRAAEFAVQFCDLHFGGKEDSLPAALDDCDRQGTYYVLNFEGAPLGWTPSNELKHQLEDRPGFLGFMLDEADHMQINAHWPVIDYYGYDDCHFLAETEGLDLLSAREVVLESLRQKNAACQVSARPAASEHLFPVMMHTAARAGLTISPKILKETCGPIMLAVAMGAARQYNTDFWIDVDYWWHNEAIGHSVERFRSALLLAYWSGADQVYVEGGAAYSNDHPVGRDIEAAYKKFLREYIPAHPRPYTWRDFRPEIAILRFDDTCFDERQHYLGEYPGPLYGHVPAGPENTEWLNIWSLLSHGFVRSDSASHQWEARRFGSRTLFVPLHNVAVYDHTAADPGLYRTARLVFLVGKQVAPACLATLRALVEGGLTVVATRRLAPPGLRTVRREGYVVHRSGAGRWIVTDDVTLPAVRDLLAPYLGQPDELRYVFGSTEVVFTAPRDPAQVQVTVRPR